MFSQDEINLPLPNLQGDYQLENASLALAAIKQQDIFNITNQDIIQRFNKR